MTKSQSDIVSLANLVYIRGAAKLDLCNINMYCTVSYIFPLCVLICTVLFSSPGKLKQLLNSVYIIPIRDHSTTLRVPEQTFTTGKITHFR